MQDDMRIQKPDGAGELECPAEGKSRRCFMGFAFAAAVSGLLLPETATEAEAQVPGALCTAQVGQELVNPGEIASANKQLQGLVDLRADRRSVTYVAPGPAVNCPGGGAVQNTIYVCGYHRLRAYHGYKGFSLDAKNSVTPITPDPEKAGSYTGIAYPGPTLRASVGDTINLIFLNRIDQSLFNYTSQISMSPGACDASTSVVPGGTGYPGTDTFPNCFHVSNTTNLHFHGTHTDPGSFGDNVLLGILPNVEMDTASAIRICQQAFAEWAQGKNPTKTLQSTANAWLNSLLKRAKDRKETALAAQIQAAIASNEMNVMHGEWPQYWPGFYPYHFELPVYSGSPTKFPSMGQAPGSHWYHCHQHGSTTLQLLNGMAGALIIADLTPGAYDASILALGGGTPANPKIKEKVLVMQLFSEQPNRINQAAPGLTISPTATVTVNGQVAPKITMKQSEVQWWRVIDAAMKAHGIERFLWIDDAIYQGLLQNPCNANNGQPPQIDQTLVPRLRQIAQDGVQFKWENYHRFHTRADATKNYTFNIGPGNRMDFLIKAPAKNGTSYLMFWPPAGTPGIAGTDIRQLLVAKVVVDGPPDSSTNTQWFESDDPKTPPPGYPQFPAYLSDIPEPNISRKVTFAMSGGPGSQPLVTIDGRQFSEGRIDQTMMKDTIEEWKVVNLSLQSIMHPYHIHINPFQITHYYDPNDPSTDEKPLPQPWIWADTKPIPAAKATTADDPEAVQITWNGTKTYVRPGYFKMRSRFADFIGKYVLHCHILGHEDRGMMQLIQVVDSTTVVKHH